QRSEVSGPRRRSPIPAARTRSPCQLTHLRPGDAAVGRAIQVAARTDEPAEVRIDEAGLREQPGLQVAEVESGPRASPIGRGEQNACAPRAITVAGGDPGMAARQEIEAPHAVAERHQRPGVAAIGGGVDLELLRLPAIRGSDESEVAAGGVSQVYRFKR